MRHVYRRTARRDLVEHYVYLAGQAGEDTAERFLAQAEQTFIDLAENREIGSSLTLRHPQLAGSAGCAPLIDYFRCVSGGTSVFGLAGIAVVNSAE